MSNVHKLDPADPHAIAQEVAMELDRMFFTTHPDETKFLRQAVPGEFVGIDLPDGMKLADIRYVLVKRLGNDWGQARIPLTIEQTKQLKDPDFFRKVSGE